MVPFQINIGEEYKDVERMIVYGISIRDKNGKVLLAPVEEKKGIFSPSPSLEYMLGASEDFVEGPNGREMKMNLNLTWINTSSSRPSEFIITANKMWAALADRNWKYIKGNWAFSIKIDETTIAKPVEYTPAGEIRIGNSTHTIDSIQSYPTGVEVCIRNGKQFYQEAGEYAVFLEDEVGNRYANPRGSSVKNKAVLSFESIYYENSKELFIVLSPRCCFLSAKLHDIPWVWNRLEGYVIKK